ncbi:hypothetical protein DL98DRAFT_216138 [Cadophora sp. DSE1049]|nr:hypothetical protein DL98DRAFT_216138 [Cadophora sp. DSE1049]
MENSPVPPFSLIAPHVSGRGSRRLFFVPCCLSSLLISRLTPRSCDRKTLEVTMSPARCGWQSPQEQYTTGVASVPEGVEARALPFYYYEKVSKMLIRGSRYCGVCVSILGLVRGRLAESPKWIICCPAVVELPLDNGPLKS